MPSLMHEIERKGGKRYNYTPCTKTPEIPPKIALTVHTHSVDNYFSYKEYYIIYILYNGSFSLYIKSII